MMTVQIQDEATVRAVALKLVQFFRTLPFDDSDPVFVQAMAHVLGHHAATLDLITGRRTFHDKLHAFEAVAEEVYRRSLLRSRPMTDVHGRPLTAD